MILQFPFDNTYARLPERFFARVAPTPVRAPRLVRVNAPLATQLGLDPEWLASAEGVAVLAGNHVAETAEPIATAYAGHQFGSFVPQLGDGRAILLGEVVDQRGVRRDIQLKGAGRTRFSRGGDGRAALGPVLREYVVSEAMAALGIPTTRALAAVATGEAVRREELLPGAILTRVASSHIRVGTFQFFAGRGDVDGLRALADDADVAVAAATESLDAYTPRFEQAYQGGLRRKLGLSTEREGDAALGRDLLEAMRANRADFTLTFRRLSEAPCGDEGDGGVRGLFADPAAYDAWAARWRRRLEQEPTGAAPRRSAMLAVNPAYIPRKHRGEAVIRAAVDSDDFAPFHELVTVLAKPFDAQPALAQYADLPMVPLEMVSQPKPGVP